MLNPYERIFINIGLLMLKSEAIEIIAGYKHINSKSSAKIVEDYNKLIISIEKLQEKVENMEASNCEDIESTNYGVQR